MSVADNMCLLPRQHINKLGFITSKDCMMNLVKFLRILNLGNRSLTFIVKDLSSVNKN